MSVLYIVLPLALLIAAGAVVGFIWAARAGQFDDLETPAHRVLHDESDDAQASSVDGAPSSRGATKKT